MEPGSINRDCCSIFKRFLLFKGSEGTEAPSLDDVSDDESEVTSPDASKSLLSPVEQERFVEDNYLKMDMFSRDADARNADAFNSRSSISAKFLTRTSQRRPPPIPTKSVALTLLCFDLREIN